MIDASASVFGLRRVRKQLVALTVLEAFASLNDDVSLLSIVQTNRSFTCETPVFLEATSIQKSAVKVILALTGDKPIALHQPWLRRRSILEKKMAIKRNGEYYTHFTHYENGQVFPRRLHRIVIRDAKGKEFILTGQLLPDAFITSSGDGHKGQHTGHILLGKERSRFFTQVDRSKSPWPNVSDILQISIGFFLFAILNLLVVHFSY